MSSAPSPSNVPNPQANLKPRTSIDTLMDRLGVLEIKNEESSTKPRPGRQTAENKFNEKRRRKKAFCCFEIIDEEGEGDYRPSKPIQRPAQSRPTQGLSPVPQKPYQGRPAYVRVPSSGERTSSSPHSQSHSRPPNPRKSSSKTSSLLSWIPSALSPATTSLLLTELNKQISTADEEGYIYMFWLTPLKKTQNNAQSPMPKDIASSLLPPATSGHARLRPPGQPRSVSDAINKARDMNALTSNPTSTAPGSICLKIGRTNNVHRRLNEWTRQCSHDLTLIRYYPYTPSSPSSSPARGSYGRSTSADDALVPGRKVPHVHRVERLIHLELADLRVRDLGRCDDCGKEHREWFEVEAAKEALRRVDACVRRWVAWANP
ncbi:hypothetical protein N7470_003219 [Penicillium chermesinum]|nr:hypothetical protein N7470_003219 [Penicillium chermesinum]